MAISHVFGTVGSGKTFDMLCRIMSDFESGAQVVTINCGVYLDRAKDVLVNSRGMQRWDADRALSWYRRITTEEEFRNLSGSEHRPVRLHVDEAPYWWPPDKQYSLDIEDFFSIAMSRKRYVDIHLTSQRKDQINKMIAGYASEVWASYKMTLFPIPQLQEMQRKVVDGTRIKPWLPWFYYVKGVGDTGSDTFILAKAAMSNKRRRTLDLAIAGCYDTREQATSPVLDTMRARSKLNRYREILAGVVRPSMTCPVCDGARTVNYAEVFDPETSQSMVVVASDAIYQSEWFIKILRKQPCTNCLEYLPGDVEGFPGGRPLGYIYPKDHPDIIEAQKYSSNFDSQLRTKRSRA